MVLANHLSFMQLLCKGSEGQKSESTIKTERPKESLLQHQQGMKWPWVGAPETAKWLS
jgi:hypothetical protein